MFIARLLLIVAALTLAACGGGSSNNNPASGGAGTGTVGDGVDGGDEAVFDNLAMAVDVTIVSPIESSDGAADTTNIDATVYVPAHNDGDTYPLILHSHGWGGNKVEASELGEDDVSADFFERIDLQIQRLWDAGYAVISFSERGWGESQGEVRVMDPEFETQDAIAVLDWALNNTDVPLTLEMDGINDPVVGAMGGSYGGGFQLLLAARDTRIDSIAPFATWYSLRSSLVPNGVQKKGFIGGLCTLATSAGANLAPFVQTACNDAGSPVGNSTTKYDTEIDAAALDEIASHGLDVEDINHAVDAFVVQGMRDVLFNFNQADATVFELDTQGGDVRFVTTQGGHILNTPPANQAAQGPATCGNLDVMLALKDWFDETLKGIEGAADAIPDLCISLDNEAAVQPDRLSTGGFEDCAFGGAGCRVFLSGEAVTGTQHQGPGSPNDPPEAAGPSGLFVPMRNSSVDGPELTVDREGLVLAGLPVMENVVVSSSATATDSVAFIGVGVRDAAGNVRLIDDQVTPYQAGDYSDQFYLLTGVGSRLNIGDTVGILLYGDHGQWEPVGSGGNWTGNGYSISGTIYLPVIQHSVVTAGS